MKLLVLTVALAAAAAGSDVTKKILRDITKFNNDAACWGIENRMQYALAQMKATEECSESDHHNLLKPANPFLALLQPVNNPFQTLPGNTNTTGGPAGTLFLLISALGTRASRGHVFLINREGLAGNKN